MIALLLFFMFTPLFLLLISAIFIISSKRHVTEYDKKKDNQCEIYFTKFCPVKLKKLLPVVPETPPSEKTATENENLSIKEWVFKMVDFLDSKFEDKDLDQFLIPIKYLERVDEGSLLEWLYKQPRVESAIMFPNQGMIVNLIPGGGGNYGNT